MKIAVQSTAFIPELVFVNFSLPPKTDCRREIGKDGLIRHFSGWENTASTILCSDARARGEASSMTALRKDWRRLCIFSADTPPPRRHHTFVVLRKLHRVSAGFQKCTGGTLPQGPRKAGAQLPLWLTFLWHNNRIKKEFVWNKIQRIPDTQGTWGWGGHHSMQTLDSITFQPVSSLPANSQQITLSKSYSRVSRVRERFWNL